MYVTLEKIDLSPAVHSQSEIRLASEVKAVEAFMDFPSGQSLQGDTLFENLNTTESVQQLNSSVEYDWTNDSEHRKFALLERKIGRGAASAEEEQLYSEMLHSRRAWIKSHNYMAAYLEEQREQSILQKLKELNALMKPLRL